MRRSGRCAVDREEQVIGIAPPPVFARFVGTDERVVAM